MTIPNSFLKSGGGIGYLENLDPQSIIVKNCGRKAIKFQVILLLRVILLGKKKMKVITCSFWNVSEHQTKSLSVKAIL